MRLCQKIPNLEWSGYAIFKEHGNIVTDPENFWIEVTEIFPMSVGTAGAVDQEPDSKISRHLMSYHKRGEEVPSYGTVHSHHNMGVFFSGTDYADLEENAQAHNYYLSIVFDNMGKVIAHIGQVAKDQITGTQVRVVLDGEGMEHEVSATDAPVTHSTSMLIDYKCNVVIEGSTPLPDWFSTQLDFIINKHNTRSRPTYGFGGYGSYGNARSTGGYQQSFNYSFNNDDEYTYYTKKTCEEFLTKWLMGESKWEGTLTHTLGNIQKALVSRSATHEGLQEAIDEFQQELMNSFDVIYLEVFGAIDSDEIIIDVLNKCNNLLDTYNKETFKDVRRITKDAIKFVLETEYATDDSNQKSV